MCGLVHVRQTVRKDQVVKIKLFSFPQRRLCGPILYALCVGLACRNGVLMLVAVWVSMPYERRGIRAVSMGFILDLWVIGERRVDLE